MFHSHGEHKVTLNGSILTVEARGPFNIEQIAVYEQALTDALKEVTKPWAQLNILYRDCLFTPEGEQELSHSIKMRKHLGVCAIAVVFVEEESNSIAELQLGRMYGKYEIPFGCFATVEKAEAWLQEQLLDANG